MRCVFDWLGRKPGSASAAEPVTATKDNGIKSLEMIRAEIEAARRLDEQGRFERKQRCDRVHLAQLQAKRDEHVGNCLRYFEQTIRAAVVDDRMFAAVRIGDSWCEGFDWLAEEVCKELRKAGYSCTRMRELDDSSDNDDEFVSRHWTSVRVWL